MKQDKEIQKEVKGLGESLCDLQRLLENITKLEAPTYERFHYDCEGLEADHV